MCFGATLAKVRASFLVTERLSSTGTGNDDLRPLAHGSAHVDVERCGREQIQQPARHSVARGPHLPWVIHTPRDPSGRGPGVTNWVTP